MKKKLTPKETEFCRQWLTCGMNATKAAILAGYSEKTAYAIAHNLLKKTEITDEIQRIRGKIEETTGITKEMILLQHLTFIRDENQRTCDRQRSLEAIAKLMGYNEAEKHKLDVSDERKINIVVNGTEINLGK